MTISLSASNANKRFIVLCCMLLSMPSELPRCIHQVQTHAPALFPKSHPKRLVCLAAGSEVAENASHLTRTSRWFKRSLQCRSYQCKETYLSIYPQITINHDVEIIKKNGTTLMNANLSQQRIWPCHKNSHVKVISTTLHNLSAWIIRSNSLHFGLWLFLVHLNPHRKGNLTWNSNVGCGIWLVISWRPFSWLGQKLCWQ